MTRYRHNQRAWIASPFSLRSAAALLAAGAMSSLGVACADADSEPQADSEPVAAATEAVSCLTLAPSAGKDAVIATSMMDPTKGSTVFGGVRQMITGHVGPDQRRIVMKFDMGELPAGAVVTSADLTLRLVQSPGKAPVDLYAGTKVWNESNVTWNQIVAGSTAGSGGLGALLTSFATLGVPANSNVIVALPATFVQTWIDPASNYGIVLDHPLSGRTVIASRETPSLGPRPKLAVCYCTPATEVCDGVDNDCDGRVDESASCDDGDPCTVDSCGATGCLHEAMKCDDGDACTADACYTGFGCYSLFVPSPTCDMCLHGEEGGPLSCDDGNPCTQDGCDMMTGCWSAPHTDGMTCFTSYNGFGVCEQGFCSSGASCGNNSCEAGESCLSCPADCHEGCSTCGNGVCEPQNGESCATCGIDCYQVLQCGGDVCGDGICDAASGEDCNVCSADCC